VCIERGQHGVGDQSRGVPLRLSSTAKRLLIFTYFCDPGKQRVRRRAPPTGRSKSSVPRLGQALARRGRQAASGCWATAAGRRWCTRLVVATR